MKKISFFNGVKFGANLRKLGYNNCAISRCIKTEDLPPIVSAENNYKAYSYFVSNVTGILEVLICGSFTIFFS